MTKTSTFLSLQNPLFKRLWVMSVISGCCVSAHDTASTWLMSRLSHSSFLISLISTVASLPFFLFTLPAGALADMTDRRKILCDMVADRTIDIDQIDMPSFQAFRERLEEVI